MKKCTICKEEKSLDNFYNYKASKDGKHYRCIPCDRIAVKGYRRGPRKESYRLKIRDNQRRFKYGLEPEEYQALLIKQDNKCAICSEELMLGLARENYERKAVVDHCHSSNKVRGILCTRCNQALGLMRDDPEIFRKAIEYLKKGN